MLFATAGTDFLIGVARPDWTARQVDADDFDGEAWLSVGGMINLGSIGGDWRTEESLFPDPNNPGAPTIPTVEKVSQPVRTMQVICDLDTADAGQARMLEAEASVSCYPFKLVLPGGAERLFMALIVGTADVINEANTVIGSSFSLVLQSTVLRQEGA